MSRLAFKHHANDNDGEDHDVVPPPPPHIELLLGTCMTHVLSYLDASSYNVAYVTCSFLRDAVNQYKKLLPLNDDDDDDDETTPKVTGRGRQLQETVQDDANETHVWSSEDAVLKLEDTSEHCELIDLTDGKSIVLPLPPRNEVEVEEPRQQPGSLLELVEQVDQPTTGTLLLDKDERQVVPQTNQKNEIVEPIASAKLLQDQASISTTDLNSQTNSFLNMVSSNHPNSRTNSPTISVLTTTTTTAAQPEDYPQDEEHDEEKVRRVHSEENVGLCNDQEYDDFVDVELSVCATEENSAVRDTIGTPILSAAATTPSPATPIMVMPSPASLTGATRLELGSMNHLGDGSSLVPIMGMVRHSKNSKECNSSSSEEEEKKVEEEVTQIMIESKEGGNQPLHNLGQALPCASAFTRPRDLRLDKLPFNERSKHNNNDSNSSLTSEIADNSNNESLSYWSFNDALSTDMSETSPQQQLQDDNVSCSSSSNSSSCNNSGSKNNSDSKNTTTEYSTNKVSSIDGDVLGQLSDAALFGGVSDILSDMMGNAKSTVTNLIHINNGVRNEIDDSGPIKIGDKYYSANEALHKWRKAKVKLEDRHGGIDDDGNVKIEKATFFEKNSVFNEVKSKTKDRSTKLDRENGEMTLNELITTYKKIEKKSKSLEDSSVNTAAASEAVVVDKERLMSVNENKTTEFRGFDVDNETAETESETNCGDDTSSNDTSDDNSYGENESSGNDRKKITLYNNEIDSVAGKDSLPSHMGVEVTSLRGTSGNFINGKTCEPLTLQGNGQAECDKSVLGSQFGTEVLFKNRHKKVLVHGRKLRRLAHHNMGVKKAPVKQSSAGNSSRQAKRTEKRKVSSLPIKLKLGIKK